MGKIYDIKAYRVFADAREWAAQQRDKELHDAFKQASYAGREEIAMHRFNLVRHALRDRVPA